MIQKSLKISIRLLLVSALMIVIIGCGQSTTTTLTVMAPNYLKGPMTAVGEQFQRETGTRVNFIFENAYRIINRIDSLDYVDVFITNNESRFKKIKDDSLVLNDEYACPFSVSLIVIGLPALKPMNNIDELLSDTYRRIVVLNPDSGYTGPLAREALSRAGLWKKLQGKIIIAHDVDHLLSYLKTGEAEAGIVLELSIAQRSGFAILANLDDKVETHLRHCGGVYSKTSHPRMAQAFLDLLDSRLCEIYRTAGIKQNL